MATRRRAREVTLQLLYEYDFGTERSRSDRDQFIETRMRNHPALSDFARSLLGGVMNNRGQIDSLLARHSSNWSISRMAVIDRNILRLGIYEIVFGKTPGRVAINEAIEIAKRYGDRKSRGFVNGILDRILSESKQAAR
ncbi:hypothetical protein CA51_11630 [Rosistilla oblonga]|uniref:Transcription antitermination protein NusB n=1 Tax=Rosistilla oblonga TaxID=2527990 RepID=A0A518IQ71_9BACT|nr:transcription antitermination factor NusB [Rosistilla oblonga]QDV11301.1 hypothetical protein CA51_11630 [Rosistilla oblonga]QDV55203.1 hypothetical protein Mal33_11730 [Rosistilla oblonga]